MEFDYPRQKRKMKRDLKLEGISVLGNIMDFVAFRKLVPDYRPTSRKPDKILKNPLINLFNGALVCVHTLFQPRQKTDNRLLR